MVQNRFNCWLTVNRICNYRCPWCYAEGTKYRAEDSMTLELAEKLLHFMVKVGTGSVYFIGGEPTLWPHLMEANTLAKDLGMETTLVTHGARFKDDKFFHQVLDNPFDHIGLSIKAGNREQHKAITGHDNFADSLAVIRKIRDAKLKFNGSIVVNRLLADNLLECIERAMAAGLSNLGLDLCSPIIDGTDIKDTFTMSPAESARLIEKYYDEIHRLTDGHFNIHISTPLCLWNRDLIETLKKRSQITTGCFVTNNSGLIFDPEGFLLPCNSLHQIKLGQFGTDFHDQASFEAYWNQGPPADFNRRITTYPSETCVACEDYDACTGGCPLNWFALKPDAVIPAR